ncbi:hypothetical protein GEMRC1_003785 [Eukaryota sp. GEM-RC1]
MVLCQEAHSTCSECMPKLKGCPICRGRCFPQPKLNYAMVEALEQIENGELCPEIPLVSIKNFSQPPGFGIVNAPTCTGLVVEHPSQSLILPSALDSTTLALAISMSSVVQFLHSISFIHTQLQPSSFIVVGDQLKLTTFDRATLDDSTCSGFCKYFAPEITGYLFPSAESDIYSLGVILYELLANSVFPDHVINFPLSFPLSFPTNLKNVILNCTALDPSLRPSIDDVLGVLTSLNELSLSGPTINNSSHLSYEFEQEKIEFSMLQSNCTSLVSTNGKLSSENKSLSTELDKIQSQLRIREAHVFDLEELVRSLKVELNEVKIPFGLKLVINSSILGPALSNLNFIFHVSGNFDLIERYAGSVFRVKSFPYNVQNLLVLVKTLKGSLFGCFFPYGFHSRCSLFHLAPNNPKVFCNNVVNDNVFSLCNNMVSPNAGVVLGDFGFGTENLRRVSDFRRGELVPEVDFTAEFIEVYRVQLNIK